MRCGVVVFPGSHGDHDAYHVLKHVLGQEVLFLWHGEETLRGCEMIVLPGGFSHGDRPQAGAAAAESPIMAAVRRFAEAGGQVLGIGNGFQILLAAGMLPGSTRRNQGQRFECRDVFVRVERNDLPYTAGYAQGQVLRMPIAHAGGCYFDTDKRLDGLEASSRVVFRYVTADGEVADGDDGQAGEWNVGGSARAIAGICNEAGNVLGLMPHPERGAKEILGNDDGLAMFASAAGAGAGPTEVML